MRERDIGNIKLPKPHITLEGLEKKATQLDAAISRLVVLPEELGRVDKPSYTSPKKRNIGFETFNRSNYPALSISDRLYRMEKVTRARVDTVQVIVPGLAKQRDELSQIISGLSEHFAKKERAKAYLEELERLHQENPLFADEEDLSLARALVEELQGTITIKVSDKLQPPITLPSEPTPPVEPEEDLQPPEQKPELLISPVDYKYDREAKTLQIEGKEPVIVPESAKLLLECLDDHRGQSVETHELKKILEDQEYASAVGVILNNFEKKVGYKGFFLRIGAQLKNLKWALGIPPSEAALEKPSEPSEEDKSKAREPEIDEGKLTRHQGARQIFDITLDGRQLKVQGRLTAVSLETLVDTSSENKMRLADLAMALYGKDDQQKMSNARGLMGINNKGSFVNLGLRAVIEGKRNQTTIYLERIPKEDKQPDETTSGATAPTEISEDNIESLQKELEDLYKFRTEIQDQVAQGIWSQEDVDELNTTITQKEAEIRLLKPLEPEDIEEEDLEHGPPIEIPPGDRTEGSTEVRFIPYEPSPEEIRSEQENKIVDFIITSVQKNRKIRFEDLQAALGPRIGRIPGGKGIIIYQAKELKDMFKADLRKFREESVIPNLRSKWTEHDQGMWDKLEDAINKLSVGDVEDFVRKMVTLIDRAEREFYHNSPPPENGGRRVQYIKL